MASMILNGTGILLGMSRKIKSVPANVELFPMPLKMNLILQTDEYTKSGGCLESIMTFYYFSAGGAFMSHHVLEYLKAFRKFSVILTVRSGVKLPGSELQIYSCS